MINGLGYKLANVPTVTGLSSVVADSIISGSTNTGQLILNGIDVSTTLTQVPINTNNITLLQIATTGITYDNTGGIDLTTISNNVTTGANSIKTSYVPIANDDVANKLYTDTKIANLVASAPATLDTLNELATALGNDPNYATSTATLIGGKASLTANQTISGVNTLSNASNVIYGNGSNLSGIVSFSANQTLSGINTLSNPSNVFYGDGSHLTGISSGTLDTVTMPGTGTFYLPYVSSATGGASQTPYANGNVSYNPVNNTLTVPNITSVGTLTLTNATNAIVSSSANTDLIIRTPTASTGSLLLKTQNTTRMSISSAGVPLFENSIYTNGSSIVGQNVNGLNIASTGTTPTITISPNNIAAISINSSSATFTNPPSCIQPPTINSHLANKQYVDSMAGPVGSIVIHSSNTIPTGWLLCDGQMVSTTTYASLYAVIGTTYTLLTPPLTGFFFLPNFIGLYTRGKGTPMAGLVSTTTTLGEIQLASAGQHQHDMATVSTNTQETTGSATVLDNVTGVPGLVKSHQIVSNTVVTTISTAGSGTTTFQTYTGAGVLNNPELRPNNISMNYIIKYGGTTTPITVPSFTQVSNILTVQNNFANSGVIDFSLRNAGTTLVTPLQLTSTLNRMIVPLNVLMPSTGTGTMLYATDSTTNNSINLIATASAGAYNPMVEVGNNIIYSSGTINTEVLTLTSHGNTTTGVKISPTSVTIGSGGTSNIPTNNIVCNGSNVSLTSPNYIELNGTLGTTNTSYLFGRNDGDAFNAVGANGLYPIGYSFNWVSSTPGITFTTGTTANYTTTSIPIGVWTIQGGAVITRGTGTFAVTSLTQVVATVATGTGIIKTLAMGTPIPSGYTGTQLVAPMSGITLTCRTACTVNFANITIMTVGTATRYNNFTFTKIA